MKEKELIPKNLLHNFPFLYKYFKVAEVKTEPKLKRMPYIAGKIPSIQNDKVTLYTFDKCISRF